MRDFLERQSHWLLPLFLVLFVAEAVTLPLVVWFTYAGRSEAPTHVLTYTANRLRWDSDTPVDQHGSARLSLFDDRYRNVKGEHHDSVVAPGTERTDVIRLENDGSRTIRFTAVLWQENSIEELPVRSDLLGDGLTDTRRYTLPRKVDEDDVVRAVIGSVEPGRHQDFDIEWLWDFYDGRDQDEIDTWLGDHAADLEEDTVTLGFSIVVTDQGKEVSPSPPTGDKSWMGGYLALMAISGLMLVALRPRRGAGKDESK